MEPQDVSPHVRDVGEILARDRVKVGAPRLTQVSKASLPLAFKK